MAGYPDKISRSKRAGFYLLTVLAFAGIVMFVVALLRAAP